MGKQSYAADTTITVEKTRLELENLLDKYGASDFYSGWTDNNTKAGIKFVVNGLQIKLSIPMPNREEFIYNGRGVKRTQVQAKSEYDKAIRARWRLILQVIKFKLEAIRTGIVMFEDEFLAYTVTNQGDDQTVSDWINPHKGALGIVGKAPPALTSGR